MLILPAIDIKDGKCVRLYKGDYSTALVVANDAFETAKGFESAGAGFIHMVDLDGAKDGLKINNELITEVAKSVTVPVEVGGGIRDMKSIEYYLENGVARTILGSAALKNPAFVKEAVKEFGEKIAVGIDAKNKMVSTDGWLNTSDVNFLDFAKKMEDIGVKYIIYTDISRDGTLEGPNVEELVSINEAVSCDIIASGGIKNIDNIKELARNRLYGAICGKSIYSGTLDLTEAVKTAKEY